MSSAIPKLVKTDFLKQYRITTEDFEKSGLDWSVLESIYQVHIKTAPELQATGDFVSQRLRQIRAVHSLKLRIKHPEHLIEKIIRKRLERPDMEVTEGMVPAAITDLIGIRALHLFKNEWQPVDQFVRKEWNLRETPVAYVRKGDPTAITDAFTASGCLVKEHEFGYRSVHYLLESQPTKQVHVTELQVRTLFEEGWSEIDHCIRYPRLNDDPRLAEFLTNLQKKLGELSTSLWSSRSSPLIVGNISSMVSDIGIGTNQSGIGGVFYHPEKTCIKCGKKFTPTFSFLSNQDKCQHCSLFLT